MERIIDNVPASLQGDLSKKLVSIVLETKEKDAIPTELAKKIIYLWRQDQLSSKVGVLALLEAAQNVDSTATYELLDELGLQELTIALRNMQ